MKKEISKQKIDELLVAWHNLIHIFQKSGDELWKGKLKGVTPMELRVLNCVYKKPDIILKDIIKTLGIPSSTLTNAVDRLEKRGLINRTISKKDRRSYGLELTQDGIAAQLEHLQNEQTWCKRILNVYDNEEEQEEFIRLLNKLIVCWKDAEKGVGKNG